MRLSRRHFGSFLLCPVLLFSTAARAQLFSQQGSKLVGSGAINKPQGMNGVNQGTSVALSGDGDTALIGGPNDNNGVGAAWVFVRSNGIWSQQGSKLVASDETGNANFGQSVALSGDGNTALVGGPADSSNAGAAWVFTRASDGSWSQQGNKLVGSGNGSAATYQGSSVSLSADGNTALSGGQSGSNVLGAWVFTRTGNGTWTQQGNTLVGFGFGPASGSEVLPPVASVALSGDGKTAALSGSYNDPGGLSVFTRGGNGAWSEQGITVGSNPIAPGIAVESVALSNDGNTLLAGSPSLGTSSGSGGLVFIRNSSGNWSQQGSALTVTTNISGGIGQSVALSGDGNTALMGDPYNNVGIGAEWVFTRDNSGNWTHQPNPLIGAGSVISHFTDQDAGNAQDEGIFQGWSVALSSDGSTGLAGGPADNQLLGAAWPFVRSVSLFSNVPGWLTQISVGADGSVWGINGFEQIYNYDFATASWNNIPGSLVQIAVGSSSAVWGINAQQHIYEWDSANSKWVQIPGSLAHIGVGADGDVWGLAQDSSVLHYNAQTGSFSQVMGSLAQIAVASAGAVYGLTADGKIFWYNPGPGQFQQITTASGFTQIAAGVDGDLWAVKGDVAYHHDVLLDSMDPTPGSIAQVAVGSGANVFGLNAGGQIYQWNANSGSWIEIPGELGSIAVGANGTVWGLNSSQQIYRFGGPTRPFNAISAVPGALGQISVGVDGSVWALSPRDFSLVEIQNTQVEYFNSGTQTFQAVAGAPNLSQISVGAGADVWGVDTSGSIYQYDAAAGNWNLIPGELIFIQVGGDGSVWGINSWNWTYKYNFSTNSWTNIPGQLNSLSVGADGTVWGLNEWGNIYRFDSGTQSWVNVQGNLAQISVGNATNIWGVNPQQEVFRFDAGLQSWVRIPNISLSRIAATFDGSVFGMDDLTDMYKWDPAAGSFNYVGTILSFGIQIPDPASVDLSAGNAFAAWASCISDFGIYGLSYSWF